MSKKIGREHAVFILLIFLLSVVFLHSIVSTSKIMNNIHHVNDVTFISQNLKESLFKHGQLYLWTPYYYSGQPLYAQPEYYFLDLNFFYIMLFRDIYIAMNLATITYFFLAGLGMYLLFLAFSGSKKGAFIASAIYMLNGYMHTFVINGNLNVLAGYSLIPFAFLFFVKALQEKNIVRNSILSGLFIALQVFSGGALLIPYEMVLFGFYSLFYLFGKSPTNRLLRVLFAGIIIIVVGFGISAVKLLPGIEFMGLSNRSSGISYQEYLGEPIQLSNIVHVLITNLFSHGVSASIGIMGFILLLFSLYSYRKRHVMFSLVLLVFSLLMATKGIIADLFFKLPIFGQLRHIERAVFLAAFASSILAGTGFAIFSEKIKSATKINKDMMIFLAIIFLILIELLFLQRFPTAIDVVSPMDIEINAYMSKDKDMFRTINLGMSTLVGASGYNYLSQLGIGTIKGGSGIWFNDYLTYLSIAQQASPAKLWGMLNNKYVIAKEEVGIPGLNFIGKFNECESCPIGEVDGPYLYENLEFMPRAYLVDKGILVIVDGQNAAQIIYSLILNSNFDPKKAVVVQGKNSVSQYNLEELKKYHAVIISSALTGDEVSMLRNYVDSGGILLPDIFESKNSINDEDIEKLFNINGNFEEIEILRYESNKAAYNVKNKKGFLVLSERFSNFPGWEAEGKGKKEILKANAITTAVFVENDSMVTFKYTPKSFTKGLLISLATLLLIIFYFAYSITKRTGGKNKA